MKIKSRMQYLEIKPGVNELVIRDLNNNQEYRLNELQWKVWELLDGNHSFEDIKLSLSAQGFVVDSNSLWEILDAFADADLLAQRVTPPTQPLAFRRELESGFTSRRKLVSRMGYALLGLAATPALAAAAHAQTSEEASKLNQEQSSKEQVGKGPNQEQASKEQASKEQVGKGPNQEQASKEQASKEQSSKEQSGKGPNQEQASKEQSSKEQSGKGPNQEQASKEQSSKEQSGKGPNQEQASKEQSSKEQSGKGPNQEQASKEQSSKEQSGKGPNQEQVSKEQASKEQPVSIPEPSSLSGVLTAGLAAGGLLLHKKWKKSGRVSDDIASLSQDDEAQQ